MTDSILSDTAKTKRIFVGTFLSEIDKARISNLAKHEELSKLCTGSLRYVPQEKLHLTWLFLGDLTDEEISQAKAALKKAAQAKNSVRLSFEKLVLFPLSSSPQALVLEAIAPGQEFLEFANSLRAHLTKYCHKPEERLFRPHITLARFPRGYEEPVSALPDGQDSLLPFTLVIEQICLVESHLGTLKNSYRIIETVSLNH